MRLRAWFISALCLLALLGAAYEIGVGRGNGSPKNSASQPFSAEQYYIKRKAQFDTEPGNFDVVMLGDSLTEVGPWSDLLPGKVANRGILGDTSKGVLNRLDQVVRLHPKFVCLLIGTNDLLSGRSVDETFRDISSIVLALRDNHISVILASVPFAAASFPVHTNPAVKGLDEMLRTFAASQQVRFVDLNAITAEDGQLAPANTVDGLHFTANAYREWANALIPILQ